MTDTRKNARKNIDDLLQKTQHLSAPESREVRGEFAKEFVNWE